MSVDGISIGQGVAQALSAQNANRSAEAQVKVLGEVLETEQAMASELLQMLGLGQKLDVVG